MSWKDILKSNCGTEKEDMDKELIGGQKELDANNNGRIDAGDFEQLREEKKEDVEAVIIRTLKDEGGASGLEPLEKATGLSKKELKKKLKGMKKVSLHKNEIIFCLKVCLKQEGLSRIGIRWLRGVIGLGVGRENQVKKARRLDQISPITKERRDKCVGRSS